MGELQHVYARRPGIVWREEDAAADEVAAALERGEEVADEGTLVLVDSGSVFELNLLGGEIWKLLNGVRSVDEIVGDLLEKFDVARDELQADVLDFLRDLLQRGWVVPQ